jgi:hypothetical protein
MGVNDARPPWRTQFLRPEATAQGKYGRELLKTSAGRATTVSLSDVHDESLAVKPAPTYWRR